MTRTRNEPGTVYKYNDVRVNVLALAALNVWRRPLPQVLREQVMDPIGASNTWRWYGYDNSWVNVDGVMVQSVSGGGHWGGGMFISACDQARFGLLTLRRGKWKDKQILSDKWVAHGAHADAGAADLRLHELVPQHRSQAPAERARASAFHHLGAGTNMIYCDPENDLVVVARWIERNAMDGIVSRVIAATAASGSQR